MPQPPKNPRLNNKVRQSQGLNTGATVNLGETIAANRQIPPTSNIAQGQSAKGAVNQVATENWGATQTQKIYSKDGTPVVNYNIKDIPPTDDSFVDLTSWQPQTRGTFQERVNQYPLPNPNRYGDGSYDARDYNAQNVLSYRDYANALTNAPKGGSTINTFELPLYDTAIGRVAFKTKWDTIARRTAPYAQHLIDEPTYSSVINAWSAHTSPDYNYTVHNIGGSKFIPKYVKSYNDNQPQELRSLVFGEHSFPKNNQMLNERQVLADIDGQQRSGIASGGQGMNTYDFMQGSKRFYELNPTGQYLPELGKYIGRESTSYELNDVLRGVNGVSDQRLIFDNTSESDYYPSAPQHRSYQYQQVESQIPAFIGMTGPLPLGIAGGGGIERKLVPAPPSSINQVEDAVLNVLADPNSANLPGYERAINNPVWFTNRIASNIGRIPSSPLTPLSVPYFEALGESRIANAQGRASYAAAKKALAEQRSGSFNMIVAPEDHRERVIAEGLMPDVPNAPVEGLYLDGKPWMPEVNSKGELSKLELPRNLAVEINGMGQFPLAGGVSTDISFGKFEPDRLVDGVLQMKEGKELALRNVVRDRNSYWGMDASDALDTKRAIADRAKAKYEAISSSPTATDQEKSAAWNAMHQHEAEYQQGSLNLQRAYTYEPQPNVQSVKVALTIPHDDSSSIDLLRSHGMEITRKDLTPDGMVIKASGNLPLDVQMKLNAELASRFNREETVLPPNVSIASSAPAFENAGISPNALVKGVEWGKNERGDDVITNPGKVVGYWKGQRVTRGNVSDPTVRQLATAPTSTVESDLQWQQLIAARDEAKQQRVDNLIQTVNLKRAERGEPLLGVDSNGQLFHLPQDSISVVSGEDIDNIVFNAAAAKRQALNDEANTVLNQALHNASIWESARNKQLAIGNQVMPKPIRPTKQPKGMQAFGDDWEIAGSDVHPLDALAANNQQQPVEQRVIVKPTNEVLDNALSVRPVFTASPNLGSNRFDLSAIANVISPVVRPATVDLNTAPPDRSQEFSRLAARERAVRNYGERELQEQQLLREWQSPATVDVESVVIPETNHYFRTDIPIEGDDTTWTYTPRPRRIGAQPIAQSPAVIVEDPANTWNRYIPAATAIAGLGLGGAAVYAMTDHNNSEEEQLRVQLMQQQMYLQQIRMGRR